MSKYFGTDGFRGRAGETLTAFGSVSYSPGGAGANTAIALKKRLGTPVAYHVYNWHEIPFNINYPHFTPARETAKQGFDNLKEAGLYIFPYLNAVSWEMDDGDEGFSEKSGEKACACLFYMVYLHL